MMEMSYWPWGQKQENVKTSILEPNSDSLPVKRLAERLAKMEAWIVESRNA